MFQLMCEYLLVNFNSNNDANLSAQYVMRVYKKT
jgi:hypothetical protein